MNQEQWRRSMDQHRQQHQQLADQQRAGWKRMNDDWDRQVRAAAGRTSADEPATLGDRVGLIAGAAVLVLAVAGSVFAWVQLRDGEGGARSSNQDAADTGPGTGQQPGTGGNGGGGNGGTGSGESEPPPGDGVVVPLLRGEPGTDAVEALDVLGLEAVVVYGDGEELCDDDSIANDVVALEPRAGTEVEAGTTVTVKVTRLDDLGTVAVPDLVGESVADARDHLEGAGLALAEPIPSDDVVVGWQDADACERLPAGSGVVVAQEKP